MTRAIHIHEDDWGMRSIYPLSAFDEVEQDLKASANSLQENVDPDGNLRVSDIYLIHEPKNNYLPSQISLAEVENDFASILPRASHFSSTMSAYIGRKGDSFGSYIDNPWCFGLDAECYVYLSDEAGMLRSISFEFDGSEERKPLMQRTFAAINALEPSVLVDYWLRVCGRLDDAAFLDRYFDMHAERLAEYE